MIISRMAGRSGIEILRANLSGDMTHAPISHLMNMWFVEVEEGRAVFKGIPGEEHYNNVGSVHGGFALTLLDFAMGYATLSKLPADTGFATVDMHARLIRPILKDSGPVRCEATVVTMTRSLATVEARVTDAEDRVLATATGGFLLKRPSP